MSERFGRELALIVGGRQVAGLRVAFRATKTLDSKPNAIEIRVWNLAPETRAAAQEKGAGVMLSAGYRGDVRLVFVGDVDLVTHAREGADWVATLQAGDGLNAVRQGRIMEAFAAGAKTRDVVRSLAKQMKVSAGNALESWRAGGIDGAIDSFANGLILSGPVHAEMDRVAKATGFEWSIQDGALQILEPGKANAKEAVILSPSTGLIGSPTPAIVATQGGGKRRVVRARSLLNGDLAPGRAVQIDAAQVKGWYRVETVQLTGDTHGPDWYVDLEAAPL